MKLIKVGVFLWILFFCNPTHTGTQVLITQEYQMHAFDKDTIVKIFTKKVTRWADGQLITVFIKPINSIEHKDFVQSWLNMSNSKYKQELEKQTYSGKSLSVVEVDSDAEMVLKISSTIGSIGYINYGVVINTKQLKVLSNAN